MEKAAAFERQLLRLHGHICDGYEVSDGHQRADGGGGQLRGVPAPLLGGQPTPLLRRLPRIRSAALPQAHRVELQVGVHSPRTDCRLLLFIHPLVR